MIIVNEEHIILDGSVGDVIPEYMSLTVQLARKGEMGVREFLDFIERLFDRFEQDTGVSIEEIAEEDEKAERDRIRKIKLKAERGERGNGKEKRDDKDERNSKKVSDIGTFAEEKKRYRR